MKILQAFQFCPRCDARFASSDKGFLECSSCGLRYFASPKPCAGVIPINEKGEVLLTERAVDPHRGKLDVLGGFLKENETFESGARREAQEELGVELSELTYVASYTHDYAYQDIEYSLAAAIFTSRISSTADLQVADDIAGYKFFKPDEITDDMLAFPELKSILAKLDNSKRRDK